MLRIHPAPEPPHSATADFGLVHRAGEEELRRERWSPTDRFDFLEAIPRELVVYDPMGLRIACLQADRPPVTGEER